MKLIERIEELLRVHNNAKYNELWPVCQKIVADSIQHSKLITGQMSNYDLHDDTHSTQVVYIIENLLGDKIHEITCYEAILLYLAAFLHDSAMALPSWEYELLKAIEGTDEFFDNTLSFRICNDFKEVHSYSNALSIISENKAKLFDFNIAKDFIFAHKNEADLISSLTRLMRDYEEFRNGYNAELSAKKHSVAEYINFSRLIRSEYIRVTHHTRVVDNVKALKKKIEGILGEFATDYFIQDLVSVCKNHGEPISATFELPTAREDLLGEKSNIQFVAMLLRLGDVIHFSSDRAPLSLFAEKKITDETSFQHWRAKFQDLKYTFENPNGTVSVKYTAFCSNPEVFYFIQDYLDWVDNELDNYFTLKQRWEQYKLDKLENYTLLLSNRVDRSEINHNKEVFIPKRNMHFVLNQAKILELLMGIQLYKNAYLCLRELYQNSLDATKCIIAINKKNGVSESLTIEFGLGEEVVEGVSRKYLYCLDHGTGMNKYIIDNFLLHIGNSYYKSKEFYRKNTEWGFEVNPTSQFGIGILSCYMLADKIGITTIHYEHNEISSFILEGINEHFYYVNAPELDTERIGKHGTIVKLYLKDEFSQLNNRYLEKLPVILGKAQSINIDEYIDEHVLKHNLSYILSEHICVANNAIPINIRCDDGQLHTTIQSNSVLNLKNYPSITKADLEHFWSDVHFFSGEPNPYLEVIARLELIENYNITVRTDNLELYSHISFPKKGMDKDNPYYYYLFHFVGQKEGSILVDGVYVDVSSRLDNIVQEVLDYDFSRHAIINFVGKERPVLSVDRRSCVSIPPIDSELDQLKTKFVEELTSIIYSHVETEKINVDDHIFSTILNIVVMKFPALADEIFNQLCSTSLRNAPIPGHLNFGAEATIEELMQQSDFSLNSVDFRMYEEVYRRILVGKFIDVSAIELSDNSVIVHGANYHGLPIERHRLHDSEVSLSSVAIKADKWDGCYKEYDLVSSLWPIVNPLLFDALQSEYDIRDVSDHCKLLSHSGNGIQGIAQLNATLINPKYGIGLDNDHRFGKKRVLLSNPSSIAKNYWLFELTNHGKDTFDNKKGASLFAFIAPRELSEDEAKKLTEFEQNEPDFVKGVKEGWSILFISNEEYVIMPGIVEKADIISKIPTSVKSKDPSIAYYNTDGTKLF